jgi:hypothetical protein
MSRIRMLAIQIIDLSRVGHDAMCVAALSVEVVILLLGFKARLSSDRV